MLLQRFLITLGILPIGLLILFKTPIGFAGFMIIILFLASLEYTGLFKLGGHQPNLIIIAASVVAFNALHTLVGLDWDLPVLAIFVLLSMGFHLIRYELGREPGPLDFVITATGAVYLGWLGSYFMALRALPTGEWWLMVILTTIWLPDTGAYFIGKAVGGPKLAPRLSPKKTWAGYLGGIVVTVLLLPLFIKWYQSMGMPETLISTSQVYILAVVLSIIPPMGDLGISMIKRYFNMKDSGKTLPGHGGWLDRTDSWIWAVVIGYYLITLFFLN
jgi:phosphatidate cytidylyltransferase